MTIQDALNGINSRSCYDLNKHNCVICIDNITLILSVIAGVAIRQDGELMNISLLIEDDDNWFILNRDDNSTEFHKSWFKDYKKIANAIIDYQLDKNVQTIDGFNTTVVQV